MDSLELSLLAFLLQLVGRSVLFVSWAFSHTDVPEVFPS